MGGFHRRPDPRQRARPLTAYIATPDEVAALCYGDDVLGCYQANMLVAIGDPVDGESPQEVVRHEYGHHVAANRVNAPWPSIDWGTKRWASQANICSRATGGSVSRETRASDTR